MSVGENWFFSYKETEASDALNIRSRFPEMKFFFKILIFCMCARNVKTHPKPAEQVDPMKKWKSETP